MSPHRRIAQRRIPQRRPLAGPRRGFTLIELLISMVIGLVVLASALSVADVMYGSVTAMRLRDDVGRQARFVGMSLQRDVGEAGVDLESVMAFGSLAARGDTLTVLSVPQDPVPPEYWVAPHQTATLYVDQGTCGTHCVNLRSSAPQLVPGDLGLLSSLGTHRLFVVSSVVTQTDSSKVTFVSADSLLFRPANMQDLKLDKGRTSAYVQRLKPVVYWRENGQLMRAERMKVNGTYDGVPIADGVRSFQVRLVFTDGDVAARANPSDADVTNDYDDLIGVRVAIELDAARADKSVRDGELLTRRYEWHFTPRNLVYERNRRAGP